MCIDPIGNYLMFTPHLHCCALTPAILDAILESESLGVIKSISKEDIQAVSGNWKRHNWVPMGHVPERCFECNKPALGGKMCCGNVIIEKSMFEKA